MIRWQLSFILCLVLLISSLAVFAHDDANQHQDVIPSATQSTSIKIEEKEIAVGANWNTIIQEEEEESFGHQELHRVRRTQVGLESCDPDCVDASDCVSGLYCFDQNPNGDDETTLEDIPGCGPAANLTASTNNKYCVDADPGQLLDYGQAPESYHLPLGECQGSCTSNQDCESSLICWQRSDSGVDANSNYVPGCIGSQLLQDTSTNFCVRPGSCQSECNRNSDCGPGWYCYGGGGISINAFNLVCVNRKYCVEASPGLIIDYGRNPIDLYKPFGACQGDCDNDDDCETGLICFQRHKDDDPVPGCFFGENLASKRDFCITPPPTTAPPTPGPTQPPFFLPIPPDGTITYHPGNLTTFKDDLLLSDGLDAKLVATSNTTLEYASGEFSERRMHMRPDAGACFPDERDWNEDGWVYVSNAEVREAGGGGVGALTFDKDGNLIDYRMVLEGTTNNCGGGKTSWNTWMSCEETKNDGNIYQVDPFGERDAEMASIGSRGGAWESFAADMRGEDNPRFFATEDRKRGALERFTPEDGGSGWDAVNGDGEYEYLILRPNPGNGTTGTFDWTGSRSRAKDNAEQYYPSAEGIDFYDGRLYFVSKATRFMFILDLDEGTYARSSTRSGIFDGKPDQIRRIVNDDEGLIYFTEDGSGVAGVHARDADGRFYTVLESPTWDGETAGLAFSPDGKYMYIAYQKAGKLYAVWRRAICPFESNYLYD